MTTDTARATALRVTRSSGDLYGGARVALLAAAPGSLELECSAAYRIAVHTGQPHQLWEWRNGQSHHGPHQRGDVVITALGDSRRVRWDRPTELAAIELTPAFVSEAAAAVGVDLRRADIEGSFSQRDPMFERMAFALVGELEQGLLSGPLFGEALLTAMAVHLVRQYGRGRISTRRGPRGGLAPRVLARVIEFLHASLAAPIALADLAKIANLSAFHFGREFRTSTGLPPHAYLIRERVDEAVRLILDGARVSDAAASVGFTSQGHLTRHMRRLLGVTPGALVSGRGRRAAARCGGKVRG
ncbi:MAG: AraC family transcriptional regulator [Myxococcales bacterium]